MKVNSSVVPSKFYIRKIELGVAYVRLRKDIVEVVDEDDNISYEFNEVEIQISDRGNLEVYITDNFDLLFQMGLIEENKIKELSDSEKIKELENALLEMSTMQSIKDMENENAIMELTMMIGGGI